MINGDINVIWSLLGRSRTPLFEEPNWVSNSASGTQQHNSQVLDTFKSFHYIYMLLPFEKGSIV